MKMKLTTLVALALGLFAGGVQAHEEDGVPNIFEIRPCKADGSTYDYGYTVDKPMGAGEDIYFKIRLVSTDAMVANGNDKWTFSYIGTGSQPVDDLFSPLMIGIYVSGQLRYAEFAGYREANSLVRDFIFKYKTQPGDFALPIRLALATGPAGYGEDSPEYVFLNDDKWGFLDKNGKKASLKVAPARTAEYEYNQGLKAIDGGKRETDYSLINANFYVKTIDFDDAWEEPGEGANHVNGWWRMVHQNSTITESLTPMLEASSAPTNAVTLYVWSMDDSIVTIEGGEDVEMLVDKVNNTKKNIKVGTVKFEAGQVSRNFKIKGVSEKQGTYLVLSAFKKYTYKTGISVESTEENTRLIDYLTVPVYCTEPLPPTLTATIDNTTVYSEGFDGISYNSVAVISVSLSQAVDKDIEVTLVPSFQNPAATNEAVTAELPDLKDYIFFSTADSSVQTRPMTALQHPKVTLPANTTDIKRIYLYVLRSDKWTRGEGNQIVFTPTYDKSIVTDPKIEDEVLSTGVWILPMKPVIVTPESGADYSATAGDTVNLPVSVKDSVADSADKTVGYTVKFKPDAMTDWVTLQKKYFSTNGSLLDEDGKPPVVTWYNEGSHVSKIKVVSPISGEESAEVSFTATIAAPRIAKLEFTDDNGGSYMEGELVNFKITLSEKNTQGATIYAFLMPTINADPGMFQMAGTEDFILDPNADADDDASLGAAMGIPIGNNTGNAETPTAGSFTILDGWSTEKGGLKISFSVVLCTTQAYNKDNVIATYSSNWAPITSYNKVPVLKDVEMNGLPLKDYMADGQTYDFPIPKNQKQEFRPKISDVMYDLTHEMQYRCTITLPGTATRPIVTNITYTAGSSVAPTFEYNFPKAGKWKIKVEARDKDMAELDEWAEQTIEFYVNVLDQPSLQIVVDELYSETDRKAQIHVGSDWFQCDDYIVIQLTVKSPEGENPGVFQLGGSAVRKKLAGYPDLADDTLVGPNQYYVLLESDGTVPVNIAAMDGTSLSEDRGFTIEAKVLGDKSGPNGVYIDTGDKWSDYYLPVNTLAYIRNERPVLSTLVTAENTNAWVVAGGAVTGYTIRFGVKSDVDADFAAGIHVTIAGCESGTTTKDGTAIASPMDFNITESSSYIFTPNFGSEQGEQTVQIIIEDKDGGSHILNYKYKVTASKFLYTYATGPGAYMSSFSMKYGGAANPGRGAGYVNVPDANNNKPSTGSKFGLTWNCGTKLEMTVSAQGYKVGDIDDGNNGLRNFGLDMFGTQYPKDAAGVTFFNYDDHANIMASDPETGDRVAVDSFLYTWMMRAASEQGSAKTWSYLEGLYIEVPGIPTPDAIITLPATEADEKNSVGGYAPTHAEAIFSREYRPKDNCGDINADGIPDFVSGDPKYLALGIVDQSGKIVGDDMKKLASYNEDNDFLPSYGSAGNPTVPGVKLDWATDITRAFTALIEVRGMHQGLNRYPNSKTLEFEPDFSDDEKRAFMLWTRMQLTDTTDPSYVPAPTNHLAWGVYSNVVAELNGMKLDEFADAWTNTYYALAATALKSGTWSPENPTDPTMEDTDEDTLPDGYEYWFWYAAKVGFSKKEVGGTNTWQGPLVGRKQNFITYGFDPIPPADIMKAFDPNVSALSAGTAEIDPLATRDTDFDGLYDKEEFLLGTNPVDYDSDDDQMPDGYEVMYALNPLKKDSGSNPDGDCMALRQLLWWSDAVIAVSNDTDIGIYVVPSFDKDFRDLLDDFGELGRYTVPGMSEKRFEPFELPEPLTFNGALLCTNTVVAQSNLTVQVGSHLILNPEATLLNTSIELLRTRTIPAGAKIWRVDELPLDAILPDGSKNLAAMTFSLIHDQVFRVYGFDPRTAWSMGCKHGYLAVRWCLTCATEEGGGDPDDFRTYDVNETGKSVNTVKFISLDEYFLGLYMRLAGMVGTPDGTERSVLEAMQAVCTNPNRPLKTTGDPTKGSVDTANGESVDTSKTTIEVIIDHGADSDGDGCPDGWELYCAMNPFGGKVNEEEEDVELDENGEPIETKAADTDRDGLTDPEEFAGTDTLAAYADCPTIGGATTNSWVNKFFPSNPGFLQYWVLPTDEVLMIYGGPDTDGDGISDYHEGLAWEAVFQAGRENAWGTTIHTFLYPLCEAEKEKALVCYRGGGMNPCAVDTDYDGIPDGWEMQHAGIVVSGGDDPNPMYTETLKIGDGVYVTNEYVCTESYIAGGMDATDFLDAYTRTVQRSDYNAKDPRTNTFRDRDFDQDGLENYQEYLTQAVRAWRYDDAETPLMGRVLKWVAGDDGRASTAEVVEWITEAGLTQPMDPVNSLPYFKYIGETFRGQKGYDTTDYMTFRNADEGYDYAALGYFATPDHEWDPMAQQGLMFMRMPQATLAYTGKTDASDDKEVRTFYRAQSSAYATTDPRRWDSDNDGMDDYWEVFHGLNPLLGSMTVESTSYNSDFPRDIVMEAYRGGTMSSAIGRSNSKLVETQTKYLDETDGYATTRRELGTIDPRISDKMNLWVGFKPSDYYYYFVTTTDAADPLMDPIRAPWRMGIGEADPDGDGLRNIDESMAAKLADPQYYHTDPTPLWMTDTVSPLSYTRQYYYSSVRTQNADYPQQTSIYKMFCDKDIWRMYPHTYDYDTSVSEGGSSEYFLPFERTEGFDTDGDWLGDGYELVKNILPASDPLNANDPDRRAAIYFPTNEPSCAHSYMAGCVVNSDAYNTFRQFTVECWVKPETLNTNNNQTILERGFEYPPANLANAKSVWRANFRLEIDKAGQIVGLFDNDAAVETDSNVSSTQRLIGGKLETNVWTHVALAFDGTTLNLYMNGQLKRSAVTSLIPANGVTVVLQDPEYMSPEYSNRDQFIAYPGATTIGARRVLSDDQKNLYTNFNARAQYDYPSSFDQHFKDYFNGHIAEVRIWDGSRTSAQIEGAYQTRYSTKDVAANREEVYLLWKQGATRAGSTSMGTLPAQLMMHYNFQQLPAAADKDWVVNEPCGFNNVLTNISTDTEIQKLATVGEHWWKLAVDLKSSVYQSDRVIPWIQNTVSRLPLLDSSFADSAYWSEHFIGSISAWKYLGEIALNIPNSGNPYKSRIYMSDAELHYWRLKRLADSGETRAEDLEKRYRFEVRSLLTGTDDLIPMGGAFAKLDKDFWDGQGSATAWTDTRGDDGSTDKDGDGLPDWWEELYRPGDNLDLNDLVERGGIMMPAYEAYLRDLAAGMQPDATNKDDIDDNNDYVNRADMDGDGLVDWWQQIFDVKGGALGDDDCDGLSNYMEYLLSDFFEFGRYLPTDAFSLNSFVSDYFQSIGKSYVGEIFSDHDRVRDTWEDPYPNEKLTRHLYDPDGDADGDGWSNYAEFQAGTDPTKSAFVGFEKYLMKEYPIPVIKCTTAYEGSQNISGKRLIVKAWREASLQTIPDAVWTVGGLDNTTEDGVGEKMIGMNPQTTKTDYLSPGNVIEGSVKIEVKDPGWGLYDSSTGTAVSDTTIVADWETLIIDRPRLSESEHKGDLVYTGLDDSIVGEIDYDTGKVTIDFTKLPKTVKYERVVQYGNWWRYYTLIYTIANSYIRINWGSELIAASSEMTYYLSEADVRTEEKNTYGHVEEGRNTFVAFYDLDDDGNYTAGEPYGVAPNVMVGWNSAEVNIELTDTSVVSARFSVGSKSEDGGNSGSEGEGGSSEAENDRNFLYGVASGNLNTTNIAISTFTDTPVFRRVRVVRQFVNGENRPDLARVVLDKTVNLENDPYLTEADFLRLDKEWFDLDWEWLADDLDDKSMTFDGISNVAYRVVLGEGDITPSPSDNAHLNLVFQRWFDFPEVYFGAKTQEGVPSARPKAVDLGNVVTVSPIFKWEIPNGFNSYTAFKVEVTDDSGVFKWNSGFQPMPPRVRNNDWNENSPWQYEWKAPLYVGALTDDGQLFANKTNYKYKVTLANARFRNICDLGWSNMATFRMDVPTATTDYGTMDVAVRYFGPAEAHVTTKPVRVQAFTTPDFTGRPVSEGYVTNVTTLASTNALVANATLCGLETGIYYVRAFIDTERDGECGTLANGTRYAWESWGCACERDVRGCAIYVPQPIAVGPSIGSKTLVKVFIDDCDTDKDNLPDAWEWDQKGNLTAMNVQNLDKHFTGILSMTKELTDHPKFLDDGDGTLAEGLSIKLRAMSNPYMAAMMTGTDIKETTDEAAAASAVKDNLNESQTIEPTEVKVTGINIAADGTITIDVTTTTESENALDPSLNVFYTFETTGSVTVRMDVWAATDLAKGDWAIISEPEILTLSAGDKATSLTPTTKATGGGGFYKVTLTEVK